MAEGSPLHQDIKVRRAARQRRSTSSCSCSSSIESDSECLQPMCSNHAFKQQQLRNYHHHHHHSNNNQQEQLLHECMPTTKCTASVPPPPTAVGPTTHHYLQLNNNANGIPNHRRQHALALAVTRFCTRSSLIGVHRLFTATSRAQRTAWSTYVGLMLLLLISSLSIIVNSYLQYAKSVQISVYAHERAPFPALTVCSRTPFSRQALGKWRNRTIVSPAEFSANLRRMTSHYLHRNDANAISNANIIFTMDSIRTYYMNLAHEEVLSIGNKVEQLFTSCIVYFDTGRLSIDSMSSPSNSCEMEIRQLSHPQFFNCYRLQFPEQISRSVTSLSLIIDLNSTLSFQHPSLAKALPGGVYEQSAGVRITVHERNLRPNIEDNGVDVEPNKRVEFVYKELQFRHVSTPLDACLEDNDPMMHNITDLGNVFGYDGYDCASALLNDAYLKKCHCVHSDYVRPVIPDAKAQPPRPYCGQLNDDVINTTFWKRIDCVGKIDPRIVMESFHQQCIPRCNFVRYQCHASYSRWTPTDWQLHWWNTHWRAFDILRKQNDTETKRHLLKLSQEENESYNLTKMLHDTSQDSSGVSSEQHGDAMRTQHVHLTLRRPGRDVEMHQEKLLLPLTEMISQIGGLGGLCLGLSCAFLVEILELAANICGALSPVLGPVQRHQSHNHHTITQEMQITVVAEATTTTTPEKTSNRPEQCQHEMIEKHSVI